MITLQQQQKVAAACIKACNIGSVEVVYDPAQGEGGALIIDGWLFIEQIAIKTKWLGGIMPYELLHAKAEAYDRGWNYLAGCVCEFVDAEVKRHG